MKIDFQTLFLICQLLVLAPRVSVIKALGLVIKNHHGYRLGGEPQIFHALRVGIMAAKATKKNKSWLVPVALMHDLVEDTQVSPQEIEEKFGRGIKDLVVALSHIEEEEPDADYLAEVLKGGMIAVLVKRFDRLDNIRSLAKAPEEFRTRKLAEIKNALPIWREIDLDGAREIEKELEKYGTQNTG